MEGTRVQKPEGGGVGKLALGITAGLAGVLAAGYLGLCAYVGTGSAVLPNVELGGISVGGMSQEQAQTAVEEQVDQLLARLAQERPEIKRVSAAAEERLAKRERERAARILPELSSQAQLMKQQVSKFRLKSGGGCMPLISEPASSYDSPSESYRYEDVSYSMNDKY